jgi:RNA polymerase sigma factor (sigma-70 family)
VTVSGTTVFVVDDDASVRKALARLVQSAGYQVTVFESAEQFLNDSSHDRGACLVLDVRMPGLDGMELQKQLDARGITIPIIFITGHGDIPMSVRAMKAGAIDFLAKPFEDHILLDAIQSAISRHDETKKAKAEIDEIQSRIGKLTPREREVMSLVITGMLNKQIAYKLNISEKTIKVHRARVMEKMQAGSVAELVRLAEKVAAFSS